jgi:[NiFe] hydrogenase diaphorase moiety large subunit
VLVSDNITDRMAGNQALVDRFCANLWIERGKVSEDGLVSVEWTSCTGMGDQGPAMLVNGRVIPRLRPDRVDQIAELIRAKVALSDWPAELFDVADNLRRKDVLLATDLPPGDALRAAIARGTASVPDASPAVRPSPGRGPVPPPGSAVMLEEIKRSNLRGRGGAGFSTGLKWEACRNAPGDIRYVVCNADEGEPGTFKDRVLLTRYADLMFEGMTVCAYAIGAKRGFLYLRGEYEHLVAALATLARRRAEASGRFDCRRSRIRSTSPFNWAQAPMYAARSALIESLEASAASRAIAPYPDSRLSGANRPSSTTSDVLCRGARRAQRRRVVPADRHTAFGRDEAPERVRRLRASGHLRIPVRRHRAAGARRLRCGRYAGGPDQRALRHLHRRLRIRSPHRLRGPADCRRVHGVRRDA